MRRLLLPVAALATAALLSFGACVGNDPSVTDATTEDASNGTDGAGLPTSDAGGEAVSDASDASSSPDADAASPRCDPTVPFTIVAAVSELNGATAGANDEQARLSPDERTVYWTSDRAGNGRRIYGATRASKTVAFGTIAPVPLTLGSTNHATAPSVGSDPNVLFFQDFNGASGTYTIAYETYAAPNWGSESLVQAGALGLVFHVGIPFVTTDGLTLVFDGESAGDGGTHNVLFESDRGATSGEFTQASRKELVELTTADNNWQPALSADKLVIYFATDRATAAAFGNREIWHATRTSPSDPFGAPVKDDSVNQSGTSCAPTWISADLCTLYFSKSVSNSTHLEKGVRKPPL